MVTFEDFKKLDLRIGRIISVADHPNATKLYVIRADWGEGEKQLVAGLKQYYTPEQLAGRTIVVVANLEPVVLRGVESQGMLLACQDGERVMLLQPDASAAPGAKVS